MTPAPPSPYYFDQKEADRVVRFFETFLSHAKGSSGRLKLEPFQKKILQDIFGWKVIKTNVRKYRRAFIFLPKKNAKTTLSAGIALYLLAVERERGAEIYSAAADRKQAGLCFDIAAEMVRQSQRLSKVLSIFRDSITLNGTNSFYKAISADIETKHGFNVSGLVFDELHAQPNRGLWDTLTGGTLSRKQPLIVAITTAGYDRTSICYDQYDYACKVRDGLIIDERFYSAIYEADPDDDPFDPLTWAKANPGLGTILPYESIEEEATRAKNQPSYLNTFKRLNLNVWTSSEQAWISPHAWSIGNKGPIDISKHAGEIAYIGLDMASIQDMVSICMILPLQKIVKCWHYTPRDPDNPPKTDYSNWIAGGWVTAVPGNAHDYPLIESKIIELCMTYQVRKIGYDRWGMEEMAQRILAAGAPIVPVNQTTRHLNEGTLKIEGLIMQGELSHGGDPVLAWMVDNVMITEDSFGFKKPDKKKSKAKIDGVMAMVMAASVWVSDSVMPTDAPGVMVL